MSVYIINNFCYSIQERYSCTRLKLHPTSGHFLAQSHGNYIALFSVNRPFKMNKAKRFEGHKASSLFHIHFSSFQRNMIIDFKIIFLYIQCNFKWVFLFQLSGYSVGFDISPDGSLVLSGDSSGQVFCYNFQTGRVIKKIQTGLDVVMDASFNPVLSSTTVVCGWNGKIQVLN